MTVVDFRELVDAMVERLRVEGLDVTSYDPGDVSIPTVVVYDGDGNEVYRREVGPLPPYDGPKRTFNLEHSPEDGPTWTDLT